jgi:hypothetical protein
MIHFTLIFGSRAHLFTLDLVEQTIGPLDAIGDGQDGTGIILDSIRFQHIMLIITALLDGDSGGIIGTGHFLTPGIISTHIIISIACIIIHVLHLFLITMV